MTVRCEACGTENRDKAMFCRGCAGKLPAFVATRRPSAAEEVSSTGRPGPSGASRAHSSTRHGRLLPAPSRVRISVIAGLMVAIGMSIAGVAWLTTDTARHRNPSIQASSGAESRLPAEASLSQGEMLDDGSGSGSGSGSSSSASSEPARVPAGPLPVSDPPSPVSDDPASPAASSDIPTMTNPPAAAPVPNVDSSASSRGSVKRPPTTVHGGGRASDPRVGCENLFFAFAARCEANHCQLPAYSRHPRCDVVREQRRKDEARRNSMPTS